MPTPIRGRHWLVALAAVALGGVAFDLAQRSAAGLRASVPAVRTFTTAGGPTDARLQSAVLLQKSDCSGNLRIFDLLHRDDVRERLRLSVIWFVGSASDTAEIRGALPTWARSVPLRGAPRQVLKELAMLGHRSSPLVVLYDQEGRVRLTSQSPRSPREFAGLRRAIEGLTWIEEL